MAKACGLELSIGPSAGAPPGAPAYAGVVWAPEAGGGGGVGVGLGADRPVADVSAAPVDALRPAGVGVSVGTLDDGGGAFCAGFKRFCSCCCAQVAPADAMSIGDEGEGVVSVGAVVGAGAGAGIEVEVEVGAGAADGSATGVCPTPRAGVTGGVAGCGVGVGAGGGVTGGGATAGLGGWGVICCTAACVCCMAFCIACCAHVAPAWARCCRPCVTPCDHSAPAVWRNVSSSSQMPGTR